MDRFVLWYAPTWKIESSAVHNSEAANARVAKPDEVKRDGSRIAGVIFAMGRRAFVSIDPSGWSCDGR